MNFLGMGPGELMVIMVLALIVFGPQKLPEIGRNVGKAIGEFRRATSSITEEINRELSLEAQPPAREKKPEPPAPQVTAPESAPQAGEATKAPLVLEIKPSARAASSAPAPEADGAAPPEGADPASDEGSSGGLPAEAAPVETGATAPVEAGATAPEDSAEQAGLDSPAEAPAEEPPTIRPQATA